MNCYALIEKSPSLEEYQFLKAAVGWKIKKDKIATKLALQNSLSSICVQHKNQVIGYGRVIGDGGLYYYIQDIMVVPEHQRRGVGRCIMNAIMEYINKYVSQGAFIGLMAAFGVADFYAKYGFAMRSPDKPGMFLWKF